ncbi:integrase core domain-containing protein [Streptosporangium sp. G11]|uniref:integrase core domain-containing protein n=1 Tax=Streptosporangium sp. G11 TaxID=3436926 RepID=UPI003EB6B41D
MWAIPQGRGDGASSKRAGPTRRAFLVRRECLDRMLITGERHLRHVLGEYADHYNRHRPHRTLNETSPNGRPDPPLGDGRTRLVRRDRLGGLIHEHAQVAQGATISPPKGLRASNHRLGALYCPLSARSGPLPHDPGPPMSTISINVRI